jgi:RNA polymerase sigma factor (sigma-70 family)
MTERSLESLVGNLQRTAADHEREVTDRELLRSYLKSRDSAAFELIVWRHASMVQAVCRRVLGRSGEVDDAFQATFLVLFRQAARVRCKDSLAGWLHGVAFRVAHRCLRSALTRQRQESRAGKPESLSPPQIENADIGPVLHAEIDRLSERLRKPLVLCLIEGRSAADAARLLNVPEGTVQSRLSRARERLRSRLVRRGVTLGVAGLGSALATEPASAGLVESVMELSRQTAAGVGAAAPVFVLAKEVGQAMYWNQTKLIAAGAMVLLTVCGIGVATGSYVQGDRHSIASATLSSSSNSTPVMVIESTPGNPVERDEPKQESKEKTKDQLKEKHGNGLFPISKETTYVTGPLDKDGFVDFEAALNERLGKGITPDKNAMVLLWKALGPTPGGTGKPPEYFKLLGISEPSKDGDYFVDLKEFMKNRFNIEGEEYGKILEQSSRAWDRPWSAKDSPHVAAWLEANEKPLAIVTEASRRPEYFNPVISRDPDGKRGLVIGSMLSLVFKCLGMVHALAVRATLHFQDKPEEAWQDILTCHRLARLIAHGPNYIESNWGLYIDRYAVASDLAFVAFAKISSKQAKKSLKDLQGLTPFPAIADKFELYGRLEMLDSLQSIIRDSKEAAKVLSGGKSLPPEKMKALGMIDWAPTLRDCNERYDQICAVMRRKDRSARQEGFDAIEKSDKAFLKESSQLSNRKEILRLIESDVPPFKKLGDAVRKLIENSVTRMATPNFRKLSALQDRNEQLHRNLLAAFALAAYRADHSQYPAKLGDLAPQYLAKVPNDLFSDKPLIYQPNENGYLLYSVGPNGNDDGGRGPGDTPRGDDLSVRMPLPKLVDK